MCGVSKICFDVRKALKDTLRGKRLGSLQYFSMLQKRWASLGDWSEDNKGKRQFTVKLSVQSIAVIQIIKIQNSVCLYVCIFIFEG